MRSAGEVEESDDDLDGPGEGAEPGPGAVAAVSGWIAVNPETRAPLAAAPVLFTAAEVMHLVGTSWYYPVAGTSLAAIIASYTAARQAQSRLRIAQAAEPPRDPEPGFGPAEVAAAICAAGAWTTAATMWGPLGGRYDWLSLALIAGTEAGRRWLKRHAAMLARRDRIAAEERWVQRKAWWHSYSWDIDLGGTHLLDYADTLLGVAVVIDTRPVARASQINTGHVAELIAEREGLAVGRVNVFVNRHEQAGRLHIHIRREDPWKHAFYHPATHPDSPFAQLVPYPATCRKPLVIGLDPETGEPLTVTLWEPDEGGKVVLVVGSKGGGKALALDTPLPTPTGWTTMGEVQAGDWLLGQDGKPALVTAATEVMHGRPCYEVEFSDGTVIVADAEHLWLTWDRSRCKAYDHANLGEAPYPDDWATWEPVRSGTRPYQPGDRDRMRALRAEGLSARQIGAVLGRTRKAIQQQWDLPELPGRAIKPRTTAEIAATLQVRDRWNHAIPAARPLEFPEAALPMDSYVLGYLLGDGDTGGGGRVACDPQDRTWLIAEFRAAGYDARPWPGSPGHFQVRRLHAVWQSLGLAAGKRIPETYQRASVSQRLALAQGLIDFHGHVDGHGSYRFTTASRALADGFRELVSGLGCVAQIHQRRGRVRAGRVSADIWEVIVPSRLPLARLPRKELAARHEWQREQAGRYITGVSPVPSVPVKCLQVSNADALYLAGPTCIPTHNTVLLNCLTERLTACDDVLVIQVNFSKHREDLQWAPACALSCLGWEKVAHARRALQWVLDEITERSRQISDVSKIVPSPATPLIVVKIDEIDEVRKDPVCKNLIDRIAGKCRSEAVALIGASQTARAEMVGGTFRAQTDVLVVGRFRKQAEAKRALDNLQVPDMSEYGDNKSGVQAVIELGSGGSYKLGRTFKLEAPPEIGRIVALRSRRVRPPYQRTQSQAGLWAQASGVAVLEPIFDDESFDAGAGAGAGGPDGPEEHTGAAAPAGTPPRPSGPAAPGRPGPSAADLASRRDRIAKVIESAADSDLPDLPEDARARMAAATEERRRAYLAELANLDIPADQAAALLALLCRPDGVSSREAARELLGGENGRMTAFRWLQKLQAEGLAEVRGKGSRRRFYATDKGRQALTRAGGDR